MGFGWAQQKVGFHHCTVNDFLQGSRGSQFLNDNSPFPLDKYRFIAALALARIELCEEGVSSEFLSMLISDIFYKLSRFADEGGTISVNDLDYIDKALTNYHSQFYYQVETTRHWSECWGNRLLRWPSWPKIASPGMKILEQYRVQRPLIRDYISFLASWHFGDYVTGKFESLKTPPSVDLVSDLLICAALQHWKHSYVRCKISSERQAHLMAYIVNLGADVQSERAQIVLQILLEQILDQ